MRMAPKKSRDYVILLLSDIQDKIEKAIENERVDEENGAEAINKIVEIKEDILKTLENALSIAISGRPGPVWLDIPLDFQWEDIAISEKDIKIIQKEIITNNIAYIIAEESLSLPDAIGRSR